MPNDGMDGAVWHVHDLYNIFVHICCIFMGVYGNAVLGAD